MHISTRAMKHPVSGVSTSIPRRRQGSFFASSRSQMSGRADERKETRPFIIPLDKVTGASSSGHLGHDLGKVKVLASPSAEGLKARQDGGDGKPPQPGVTPPPLTSVPTYGVTPMDAGTKIPTLALSGTGSYADGTESHEKITYTVDVPAGASAKDYCLVQWTKGSAKNGDGKYFKSTDYGNVRDWNYADSVIDSVDPDPIYWSDPTTGRWNYNQSGSKFTATVNPGPALTVVVAKDGTFTHPELK